MLLLLAGVNLFYLMSMMFLIPVFWLQSRPGIREVFWSLERLGLRPHGIYRGWMRRLLVSLLPFAFICSYPVMVLFEGAGPLVLVHTAAVLGGSFLLVLWMCGGQHLPALQHKRSDAENRQTLPQVDWL